MKVFLIEGNSYCKLPDDFNGTDLDALEYMVEQIRNKNGLSTVSPFSENFKLGEHDIIDEMFETIKEHGNGTIKCATFIIEE